jgi:transcription initiation factor TFIIIB Brf1 subunit/transcription initiation factor TFIIB
MESLFPGKKNPFLHDTIWDKYQWETSTTDLSQKDQKSEVNTCKCQENEENIINDEYNICKLCGNILDRTIEATAEYRFFGHDDRSSNDPCRIGPPTDSRFPSSSLGTIILTKSNGGTASARHAMVRIRRYHTWNMLPYKERALLQVYEMLALAATNHGLDQSVTDSAKNLYVQLVEHCDKRGLSRMSVIASCMYASLKKVGQPRKPKEVAEMFHLTTAQFTKSFKYFQEVLALAQQRGLIKNDDTPANFESTRAKDYISYPLSLLPISRSVFEELRESACEIATYSEENELSPENMPPSLAAGVISFVLLRKGYTEIAYDKIASVCGVSEGTLQKCLRRLEVHKKRLEEFIPNIVKKEVKEGKEGKESK